MFQARLPATRVAEVTAQSQRTDSRRMSADDVKRGAVTMRIISVCGGPEREDGMENLIQDWNGQMDVFDLVRSSEHDIADEGHWCELREKLTDGFYDGGWHSPPCGSFCANRGRGDGPRVLRG